MVDDTPQVEAPLPQVDAQTDTAFDKAFTPPEPVSEPVRVPVAQPEVQQQAYNVINPEGKLVSIPGHQLGDALSQGYQVAAPEAVEHHFKEEKYGGIGEQIKTGLEGAASAATFGLSTAAETAAGVKAEDIAGRRETNPGVHALGSMAGLGTSMLTGVGEGAIAEQLGKAAAEAAGFGEASALAKIGSAAVKGATENVLVQGGDEIGKMFSGLADPNTPVQTAITDVGLAGLIGAGVSGGLGAVNPLWKSAMGSKLGGVLKAVSDRVGGVEGAIPDAMEAAIQKTGVEVPAEIRAYLSGDPELQQMAKTLEQSDTTKSGIKYQESLGNFKKQLGDSIAKAFGKDPEALTGELSKYQAGGKLADALADEVEARVDPLSKEYDNFYNKYKGATLDPSIADKSEPLAAAQSKAQAKLEKLTRAAERSQKAGDPGVAIEAAAKVEDAQAELSAVGAKAQAPGTADKLSEKIGALADRERWTVSPSSDIMQQVNRISKELPNLKSINDLSGYIRSINDKIGENPLNGPLRRALGMVKGILRDEESELIGRHVGSEEGEAQLAKYAQVRQAYAKQAQLTDMIDDRLHLRASTSGYAKAIRAAGREDGETILRRLSGERDSHLLQVLSDNFPKTAQALREYHAENLLQTAAAKAKPGQSFNTGHLLSSIDKMSPELRNFVVSAEQQQKVKAVGTLLDELNKLPHNFSNTARTADKLLSYIPGSAVGLATMLAGHNPALAVLMGTLTKTLGKDVPDSVRLGLLKFLGSSQKIDAEGFKHMIDYMSATAKGENLTARAVKAIFKSGQEVLPQTQIPTPRDREKLDKAVRTAMEDPEAMFNVGGKTGHYLPDHQQAMATTTANAVQYLSSLRPNEQKKAPLDPKPVVSSTQKAAYNRALDIAQQPLVVMNHIKQGTLTPQDCLHLKNLYPALYSSLSQKLTDQIADVSSKDQPVPYKQRIMLSLFLGTNLDSSLSPQSIIAAQPVSQQQNAQQPQGGSPKHSTSALNKLPAQYQTANQSCEQRRSKA